MERILIVDEDAIQLGPLSTELSLRGIEVTQCETADECLRILDKDTNYSLLLVDLMLTADNTSTMFTRQNTDNYLVTGIALLQEIRKRHLEMPAIIFTNASSAAILRRVENVLPSLPHTALMRKYDFASELEFAERIRRVLDFGIAVQQRSGPMRKLFDTLILEPNFAGVGVDLRRLFSMVRGKKKQKGQQSPSPYSSPAAGSESGEA